MTRHVARSVSILLGFAATSPALPADLRDFCTDEPGLGTPSCTLDKRHVALEIGAVDWVLDREGGSREDTITAADILLRYGVTESLEVQLGWEAYGHVRVRESSGTVRTSDGTGDVRLALRQNLANPDGSGLSLALMPYVTLPTGGSAIGDGGWSAGLLLPVSYQLGEDLFLEFTGEIADAANEQGGGHHLAYGGIVGIDAPLTRTLSATAEFAAERDEEPGRQRTDLLAGLSLAMVHGESLQFGAGANIGLNHSAPDLELYLGFARRF